ncbi:MAG: D-2-hydroxyacid dehydrogenase [Planctomycetes bacterium]|nr:D-2-hydroxyacid dehydrogenase [Planctomycetota bacterium]
MNPDRPRIVVLDGSALNPGDLSWEPLQALGQCTIHDRTTPNEVLVHAEDAQILLTNKVALSGNTISALGKLKYIGVTATGVNVVDSAAAAEQGILVTNVPSYGTSSVAQMVFAHVLHHTQHVGEHADAVRSGRWSASEDWCFWDRPLVELSGLTMGIVGLGQIGRAVARLAHAFGMTVLAATLTAPNKNDNDGGDYVRIVPLDTLFRESDVVSLHCPLTPETEGLVNHERLALMKETSLLINTARGPLVNEAALAEALNTGRIAGAGLDVLSAEPPPADNRLLAAKNCYVTPHIAWATRAARSRLLQCVIENVAAYLAGKPINVVGP